jgi:hypothetical protein
MKGSENILHEYSGFGGDFAINMTVLSTLGSHPKMKTLALPESKNPEKRAVMLQAENGIQKSGFLIFRIKFE